MSGKTILILGAGVGGLIAANELRRLLPPEHRVILVEKDARHAFAPSFLWLMSGDRRPEQIVRDVRQLTPPGVELILAEAQAIDLANRAVRTSAQTVNYDYLIVALDAELAPETIPGLAESAHTFYTYELHLRGRGKAGRCFAEFRRRHSGGGGERAALQMPRRAARRRDAHRRYPPPTRSAR